jgi:hypothetical protein
MRETLARAADKVRQSDVVQDIDVESLVEVAIDATGATNRRGEVKRWRVAKAAINPAGTVSNVVRAVGKEAARQRSRSQVAGTSADEQLGKR